ncbi:hypothetical protein SAMN05192558_102274 [Actinokineospora alba]|uniref:Secreted protein n=1 Tax=Actinokineospora alba TaxID=504798 RepID=A0A1H0HW58_9PSEU|nr:hypothetical protein [Actinokineospora alba]TDP64733.1 hypothetical protein C8E96_0204 [Actinokineospora alba]SDH44413.1 hypothetical protein SAMN05421871_10129 [Actinokineospora alba]SDO22991.1 hypothetical protein SAMN05192558_102274 [Actinokineospora alba]
MRKLHWASWAALGAAVLVAVVAIVFVVMRSSTGTSPHQNMGSPMTLAAHSDGLSDFENGFRFEPVTLPTTRGDAVPVAFRILGPSGKPETQFQLNATKQLHFFVVRDDMQGYQHLHPELVGDTWKVAVAIADGGAYRMFAEFIPMNTTDTTHPVVLGLPFAIAGDTATVEIPAPAAEADAGSGYRIVRPEGAATVAVRQPTILRFSLRGPDGKPLDTVDPHLGAYGHMTGFHTALLSATHLHPREPLGAPLINGELTFQALFGERGEYRLFLEFNRDGQVHRGAFTVFVS